MVPAAGWSPPPRTPSRPGWLALDLTHNISHRLTTCLDPFRASCVLHTCRRPEMGWPTCPDSRLDDVTPKSSNRRIDVDWPRRKRRRDAWLGIHVGSGILDLASRNGDERPFFGAPARAGCSSRRLRRARTARRAGGSSNPDVAGSPRAGGGKRGGRPARPPRAAHATPRGQVPSGLARERRRAPRPERAAPLTTTSASAAAAQATGAW